MVLYRQHSHNYPQHNALESWLVHPQKIHSTANQSAPIRMPSSVPLINSSHSNPHINAYVLPKPLTWCHRWFSDGNHHGLPFSWSLTDILGEYACMQGGVLQNSSSGELIFPAIAFIRIQTVFWNWKEEMGGCDSAVIGPFCSFVWYNSINGSWTVLIALGRSAAEIRVPPAALLYYPHRFSL